MPCTHGAPAGNICAGCESETVTELLAALDSAPPGAIPLRAIIEVVNLLAPDARGDGWRGVDVPRHVRATIGHAEEFRAGERIDHGTGRHKLGHVASRALFALELELDKEEK